MQPGPAGITSEDLLKLKDVYKTPGHLIRRAQQIAVALFSEELGEFGVTPVQFASLIAIRDNPGIDQKRLGHLIAIDRSTITNVLNGLEKKGFVCRIIPANNQRIKQLFTLSAGNELLVDAQKAVLRVQERLLAPLTEEQHATFIALLTKIVGGPHTSQRTRSLSG